MPRLIDADRLLSDRMKSKYYHLPNGDVAIPLVDIEHAPNCWRLDQHERWTSIAQQGLFDNA